MVDDKLRYTTLDIVRCIAIVLLLFAHISAAIGSSINEPFGIPRFYYVTWGGVAVTLFLIVSGAVLQVQYGDKDYAYIQFIKRRFSRIYPVYYTCLIFGIGVYCLRSWYLTGHALSNLSILGIDDIILSFTGFYAFVGKWGGPFNDASWYIALIISMYFVFPLLSKQMKMNPHRCIVVLLLISIASRLFLGINRILPYRPLDWFPLCRIFEFSLGVYLVTILPKTHFNKPQLSLLLTKLIKFFSELSFPLFLVHYPFLFMIKYLTTKGVNLHLAILTYLTFSITLSWIILIFDKKIPRSKFSTRKNIYMSSLGT